MLAHAPFAPSAAEQWVHCARALDVPPEPLPGDGPSDASEEGTLAHAVLAAVLRGERVPSDATEQMIDYAEQMARHVRERRGPYPLFVESRVDAVPISPDCWDTPDIFDLNHERRRVTLWDYKYGHRFVESVRNWQLACYLIGIRHSYGIPPGYSYEAWIYQPRCHHYEGPSFRKWVTTDAELDEMADVAAHAVVAAGRARSPATTGPHCRYCRRRHTCQALESAVHAAIDISRSTTNVSPDGTTIGSCLTEIAAAMERLEAMRSALELLAMDRLRQGEPVPGWMVGHTSPHRKWSLPDDQIREVMGLFGADVASKKVITPAQALAAGVDESVVKMYSIKPPGSVKLLPLTAAETRRRLTP